MLSARRLDHARARLRAGDDDRERTSAELTRHCAEGRLSAGELAQRVELALGAVTLGELDLLLSDLPAEAPQGRRPLGRPAVVAAGAVFALGAVGAGGLALAAEAPEAAAVLAATVLVLFVLLLVVVVPLLVVASPFIAAGVAGVWLARRLREQRLRLEPAWRPPPVSGLPRR